MAVHTATIWGVLKKILVPSPHRSVTKSEYFLKASKACTMELSAVIKIFCILVRIVVTHGHVHYQTHQNRHLKPGYLVTCKLSINEVEQQFCCYSSPYLSLW